MKGLWFDVLLGMVSLLISFALFYWVFLQMAGK